jgi:molybdopterin/thiamine biosynthesis adenylyltransferase
MKDLNETQKIRYAYNILLTEIGIVGQQKLLNSRVLVVGAGGLGSPALLYLACSGVGTIGIIDGDGVF